MAVVLLLHNRETTESGREGGRERSAAAALSAASSVKTERNDRGFTHNSSLRSRHGESHTWSRPEKGLCLIERYYKFLSRWTNSKSKSICACLSGAKFVRRRGKVLLKSTKRSRYDLCLGTVWNIVITHRFLMASALMWLTLDCHHFNHVREEFKWSMNPFIVDWSMKRQFFITT